MEFSIGLDKLPEALREIATSQIPFAVSQTINSGMFHTLREVQRYMDSGEAGSIKGGALPFTKKGMRVTKATKYSMHGNLRFETNGNYSREYLIPILRGGKKDARKTYIPVPDKEAYDKVLTKRGNFKRNWLQNALDQAINNKSRKKGAAGGYYTIDLPSGGYLLKQRDKTGEAKALVWFKDRSRDQEKTFDAVEFAEKAFFTYWDANFHKELEIITYNELLSRMRSPLRLRRL